VPSFKGFPPDAQCRTGGCVRLCWSVGIYRANAKGYHRANEGVRMTVLAKVLAKALAADLALAAFIGFALALSQIPVRAQSVADFYRGKSIDLNIGYGVGGGYVFMRA